MTRLAEGWAEAAGGRARRRHAAHSWASGSWPVVSAASG